MKRQLFILAFLALAGFSCQESDGSEQLQKRVLASAEFAAFMEAYESRGAGLMQEKQEEHRRAEEELANLGTTEKLERRRAIEQQRLSEQQKEQELKRHLDRRNSRISALLSGEQRISEEELQEAIRQIDEEMGTTPEMLVPARTKKMKQAMAALMEKFPEIREQEATFLQECVEAYEEQ